ncbi:MAG: transglycosylase domain-containing protein [Jiangellaceae bacterium]|nr:transglycosylase domain-containing protein [Jiangellaceae bacterium]
MLGLFALGVAVAGVAFAMTDIPAANDFSRSQATIVYWSDAESELGRFSAENRESVGIEQIPPDLQRAVIAAEDRSFYENRGFDPVGIARAAWTSLRGGEITGGGSGITQQYVKNYYLTQERTITRKIRELFIAIKIDQQTDKDQILEDYLNTIWFGRGTYGVQTASKAYFGKSVAELSLEESVTLAAILRSPARYDPTLDEDNAGRFTERFEYVLDGMVQKGWLDRSTADSVVPPTVLPEKKNNTFGGPNGYLLQQVKRELEAAGIEPAQIETGGLRVVTTFDQQAQRAAAEAVAQEFPPDTENADGVHVGLAAVKPGDGGLVAMYGGPDAVAQPFDYAIQGAIQPGSAVKPFTLLAALENDISLKSRFAGNSPFEDERLTKPVRNEFDEDYGRLVDLVTATERSINTAFVDLTLEVGPQNVFDAMVRAGIPKDAPGLLADGVITLGTASVTPVQLAGAYATIAAGGQQADWYTVASVTDQSGAVRYERQQAVRDAFEADVVADATYAMSRVIEGDRGTGTEARKLERPAAGKTGTAALREDTTTSSWFAGFTPQLAAAVGFSKGDATENLDGVGGLDTFFGGEYPARVWTAFMKAALKGQEVLELPEPAGVGEDLDPSPTATPRPRPSTPPPMPETCPPGTEGTPPDCAPVVTQEPDAEAAVPSVLGLPEQQAAQLLNRAGFEVGVDHEPTDQAPPGIVIGQDPSGGTAPAGSTVTIVVSAELPVSDQGTVPDVVGLPEELATQLLKEAGFEVAVSRRNNPVVPEGQVIAQRPGGGSAAPLGSTVRIVVSEGP